MTNVKNTKRALLTSALAILACVAMLIGTTFAWFTDTASTAVNKIVSGNLHVEIQDEAGEKIEDLDWKAADNRAQDDILWEPGCTYTLTPFKIVNTGKLALKYKIVITGLNGDSPLLKVIHFAYKTADGNDFSIDDEKRLGVGEDTGMITISASMDKDAGNDYQDKTLKNVKFTVYATQDTVEYDSKDNLYDKDAEYATPVGTVDELTAAVNAGENVILKNNLSLASPFTVTGGKAITIDLNGKTVTATGNFVTVEKGSKLTVTGGTVNSGRYVFAVEGGEVTVSDGNFTAQEAVCALFGGSKMTINGGTFTSKDNNVVATNGSSADGCEITINGGVFNANITSPGYIACGVYVANKDTVTINGGTFNVTDGVGVLMRAGTTTIGKDVVINLTNTGKVTAGRVGDASIDITTPSYLVVDVRSHYPASGSDFNVINNSRYDIVEYK